MDRECKVVISAQVYDSLFDPLFLLRVDVDFSSVETKMLIADAYSGKTENTKLGPLLGVVSTALEAKMIGEIGSEAIDGISRFSLFEAFIFKKFADARQDGFLLLASIARTLSEHITFSLSERVLDKILRKNAISASVYQKCLDVKLLEENLGKISFGHEMFYNFFVAESVVRFADDVSHINDALNAPKNHDKKLLIIGSIDDDNTLYEVLCGVTDVNLLLSLALGDGGHFCSGWLTRQLQDLLQKIEQLVFEMSDVSVSGINFVEGSLMPWSDQEKALISVIPFLLTRGHFAKEIFALVAKMDSKGNEAVKLLRRMPNLKILVPGMAFLFPRTLVLQLGVPQ